MLVFVGSALSMLVSVFGFADVPGEKDDLLDPSRSAAPGGFRYRLPGRRVDPAALRDRARFDNSRESLIGRGNRRGSRRRYEHRNGRRDDHILINLAGMKPLERRFMSVKQQRNIHPLVERSSGRSTVFTTPWIREVSGSRTTDTEFATIHTWPSANLRQQTAAVAAPGWLIPSSFCVMSFSQTGQPEKPVSTKGGHRAHWPHEVSGKHRIDGITTTVLRARVPLAPVQPLLQVNDHAGFSQESMQRMWIF